LIGGVLSNLQAQDAAAARLGLTLSVGMKKDTGDQNRWMKPFLSKKNTG